MTARSTMCQPQRNYSKLITSITVSKLRSIRPTINNSSNIKTTINSSNKSIMMISNRRFIRSKSPPLLIIK